MASPIAVLDANVLYPAPLRDLLLQLATTDAFQPRWTQLIHDEWIRNLTVARPELAERLLRTQARMDTVFPHAIVEGFEHLIDQLHLPDPDDRHVLAAAMATHAEWIITWNLVDFPDAVLELYDIKAIDPDDFLLQFILTSPAQVISSARACRSRLRNPARTVEEYLGTLEANGLTQTVGKLREVSDQL